MHLRTLLIAGLLTSINIVAARGDDWGAWRGPERTGISKEQGLAKSWPESGPKLLWKTEYVGEGFSTPSVAGGVLYVMGNKDNEEFIYAVDVKAEGKLLWKTSLGAVRHQGAGYPGPRSTPTVDGSRVYTLGLNGDIVCLDAESGKIEWRHDLVGDFGGSTPTWGYSESVLIDGPWALATPGGSQATLAAFDKLTGKNVWSSGVGDGAGYSSIIKAEIGGVKQYVQFTASALVGIAAADGKPLWRYEAPANGTANASTPLVAGDRAFASSGYGTGGGAVTVTKSGSEFKAEEAFFTKQMKNHHGGMVLIDGYIYGSDDPGVLTCIELATGETKWRERKTGKCSLIALDGMMLITRSEQGKVCLVKISPEAAEVVSEFSQPDRTDKPSWAHPVVADGKLYLRDQDLLQCYNLK
jgi:outer membrane protein assembly factor BamB